METRKDSTFSDGSGQDPAQTKVQLKQNLFDPRPNPTAKKGLDTWGTPKKRARSIPICTLGTGGTLTSSLFFVPNL